MMRLASVTLRQAPKPLRTPYVRHPAPDWVATPSDSPGTFLARFPTKEWAMRWAKRHADRIEVLTD